MVTVCADTQLSISVNNKIGSIADITHVIAQSGINMVACCAYAVDNNGVIMFVCDNPRQALKRLKEHKYAVREEEVILLTIDNTPGALEAVTQKISAAGVEVTLLYGSVDKKGKTTRLVMIAENNDFVMTILKMY